MAMKNIQEEFSTESIINHLNRVIITTSFFERGVKPDLSKPVNEYYTNSLKYKITPASLNDLYRDVMQACFELMIRVDQIRVKKDAENQTTTRH